MIDCTAYDILPDKHMSSGRTWTLWQRLPPRYQLTTQYSEIISDDNDVTNTEDALPTKLYTTPRDRPQSAVTKKRTRSALAQRAGSEMQHSDTRTSRLIHSFPRRDSDYVNHIQSQRRVNSARRRFAESPPSPAIPPPSSPPVPSVHSTPPRAQTAPIFPITNLQNYSDERRENAQPPNKNNASRSVSRNNNARPKVEATKVDWFQFDDSKSVTSSTTSSAKTAATVPKKYVIQETNEAVMYIDNGKVTYFKKSRHDLTNLLKTQSMRADKNSCFLAEIRKDYLKHPKYEAARSVSRLSFPSNPDPGRFSSDRVHYNRRIDHILNYYSDDEETPPPPQSQRSSASRTRSSRGSRAKGLSLTGASSRPPSRNSSPSSDRSSSSNDFIKLNRQLKLHNRQFYLRTPSLRHKISSSDLAKCRCSLCRVELQLALVTGMGINNELALMATGATLITNKQNKYPLNLVPPDNKVTVATQCGNTENADDTNNPPKAEKESSQRVTFNQPEVAPQRSEHTLTISCTLPEVSNMAAETAASDSGLESTRTLEDTARTVQDEIPSTA